MVYSLQNSLIAKVVGISLVLMLSACTSDQRYKRQVSGNEAYLSAEPLKNLNVPAGEVLPLPSGNYDIPPTIGQGALGKQLDIRPPMQPLALLSGSRVQYSADSGTLLLETSAQNQNIWSQVINTLRQKNIPIANQQDATQTATTGWVKWHRLDEDNQYEGRYQISVQQQGYQQALIVKTLELRQQGSQELESEKMTIQRYNSMMINSISEGLDTLNKQVNEINNPLNFDVQSGTNDVGLPVLIVRSPFDVVWDRLPVALKKLGMNVGDRNRQQGSAILSYKALNSSDWQALGGKDPELKEGDYKLQVGDLNNRTSLQFSDNKGKPLSDAQNKALGDVLQAALKQSSLQ